MNLNLTTNHNSQIDHDKPVITVASDTVACIHLDVSDDFDRTMITAGTTDGVLTVRYAGDDEDTALFTATRTDGGPLRCLHGNHSTALGFIQIWVFDPSAAKSHIGD